MGMAGFSDDQLTDFQDAFSLFDSRGDGKISISQLGDPDERIGFEVFLPILQTISKNRSTDTAEDFIEGLRHFDKDGNGFISSAELRHLLTTLGEKLNDDEVEQLLAGQEDSQGNVNYEDFVRMVMSG
ncbi:myosin-2 essential light chain [Caerostris extrusa]|uniref:Myosin-2 essential light chain n=1 Tax=Caerostris extrusa TaxID=172846 RepID=A0AAV4W087_CAEEX|nr:myosin-2 essential light chain [Caerostris extrusa]